MFRNYLLVAFRNFRKNRSLSMINIAGLAVGIACFLLIMLYVQYEFSFDRYHEKADRIYRVVAHQPGNFWMGTDHFVVTQRPLAKALKNDYAEVLEAVTIDHGGHRLFTLGEKSFYEDILWADPSILDIFTFPLSKGDPASVLADPYSLVLSEELAEKFFPGEDPIGKTILYQEEHELKVTGVMKNIPKNSHFHFSMLAPFSTLEAISTDKRRYEHWGNSSFYTYILLPDGYDPAGLEAKLPEVLQKYRPDDKPRPGFPGNRYYLQRLKDIHLHSRINFDIGENNDIRYLYLLSGLAILILSIACINYMNLTTARATQRAREIGMRKVVGAQRGQLIKQFLGESLILTFLATTLAAVVVSLLLPAFSRLVDRELTWPLLFQGTALLGLVGTMILVGVASGSYPAFFLTAYKPTSVLKGVVREQGRARLRNMLVIVQFAASVGLIISTLAVHKQLHFIKTKKLGYNREQIVVMTMRDKKARKKTPIIREKLLQHPGILKVTVSGHLPTQIGSQTSLDWTGSDTETALQSYNTVVDYDFLDVFEIELVEGRNFSLEFGTDSTEAYIINETLRDMLGWTTAVGQPFGDDDPPDGRVIGVIKDFHMHSLRHEIRPLFLRMGTPWSWNLSAKIKTDQIPDILAYMESVWKEFSQNYPFEHYFLDDRFDQMYASEQKLGEIFGYFTALAIFVACLGLFGLASYTAEQKTKEIGIRKVLGASMRQLLTLLSRDYVKLILLANLLAAPIAWYAMNQWLQGFAYRTSLGLWIFVLTAAVALGIALLTVGFRTVRAATENPVEALRYE